MLRRRPQSQPHRKNQFRAFVDARVKWIRDRGLDHAVEKEKHLLPFHNVKDLLLSSSSPSLPLSSFSSPSLRLPFRPIRFLRLFPNAFLETPCPQTLRPLISPTTPLLKIHDEETQTLTLTSTKSDSADRLLRLLMLSPRRRIPLSVLDRLRYDLGLPRDFPRSLLPDFPDYFQIVPSTSPTSSALDLELVCYSKDLAVSAMERYASRTGGYSKGMPLAFPLNFSRGFDMEKKVRQWVEQWQKLPYISPYEIGARLPPKSDIKEKWAVGVLHEVLSLMVPKKTEKENLFLLGEHLGLPAGFGKMIMNHPGIFYVSNKLRTQTVVLREAYRRDLLLSKHPLMGLRYQYIHLMHKGKESGVGGKKGKSKSKKKKKGAEEVDYEDEEDDDKDEEAEGEISEGSENDMEDEESDDDDDEDESDYESTQDDIAERYHNYKPEEAVQARPSFVERDLHTKKTYRERNGRGKSHGRSNSARADRRSSSSRRRVSA